MVLVNADRLVKSLEIIYQRRLIDLSKIEIPVLSCGNWGGNALHLRGNTEGYLAIPSKQKYLEIHGLEHFTEFYTEYGRKMQKDFLDHYLRNPKLILGMFKALPMNELFKILTHEKVWDGNAMYTHNMDMRRKEFSGMTTIYSEKSSRPYLLLPVIPVKNENK